MKKYGIAARREPRTSLMTVVCTSGFSDAAAPAEPKTSTRWS